MEWLALCLQSLAQCQKISGPYQLMEDDVEHYLFQLNHLRPKLQGFPFQCLLQKGTGTKKVLANGTQLQLNINTKGTLENIEARRGVFSHTFYGVQLKTPLQKLSQEEIAFLQKLGFCLCKEFNPHCLVYPFSTWKKQHKNSFESKKKKIPPQVETELQSWEAVYQSPYSLSFYNSDEIDWHSKPVGSLRISDHWNFKSRGQTHCTTTEPYQNRAGVYALGRYNGAHYEILRVLS